MFRWVGKRPEVLGRDLDGYLSVKLRNEGRLLAGDALLVSFL